MHPAQRSIPTQPTRSSSTTTRLGARPVSAHQPPSSANQSVSVIHGHEERDEAGDPGLGAVPHQEPSCVLGQQEDRGRLLQGRRVRRPEPQLRRVRGERPGHPHLARVAGPPVRRHRRQGRPQLRAGEAHRGRARAHHHAVPPGVRGRGPHRAWQEPGAAAHGGDRVRPHRAAGGGRGGAHRGGGHGQQHGVGGGGPADAHPCAHAQLPAGPPPGRQRGVGPRRRRAPGLRPGGQDGGHRRRRPHRQAAAPAPQALRLQPALPRQAPRRRRAGAGARRRLRGGPRRHAAQVRRRRAQHAAHRQDKGHVQQGEDRQDEERRHHREQRSWSHHGHAGGGRRLQEWAHRRIRRRRVVPAAGAQGAPMEVHAQQRHDPSHLRHHHRRPAEVRGRRQGHAGEVLQGAGLPGAQLHCQGRQARQSVPVRASSMDSQLHACQLPETK